MLKVALLLALLYSIRHSNTKACRVANQDLIFVVGTTSGPSAWHSLLDFVNHIIDGFHNIGAHPGVRVALVHYLDRRPSVAFQLDAHHNKTTLTKAVGSVDYIRGDETPAGTGDLATAINVARSIALQSPVVEGWTSWKTFLVIVDGQFGKSTPADMDILRKTIDEAGWSEIELVVVGIGVHVKKLLSQIGKRNGTWFRTICVDDHGQLDDIVAATSSLVCPDGAPLSAVIDVDTADDDDYHTYLDSGVYPDASLEVDYLSEGTRGPDPRKTIAITVVFGLVVVLMIAVTVIIYCCRKHKGSTRSVGNQNYRGLQVRGLHLNSNVRKNESTTADKSDQFNVKNVTTKQHLSQAFLPVVEVIPMKSNEKLCKEKFERGIDKEPFY